MVSVKHQIGNMTLSVVEVAGARRFLLDIEGGVTHLLGRLAADPGQAERQIERAVENLKAQLQAECVA